MNNPAYVNWVTMVKGGKEKLVHPGNVVNHEQFGWVRKEPDDTVVPPGTNPEFAHWVMMVKGSEQKLVHPGNVGNHINVGWARKFPEEPIPEQDPMVIPLFDEGVSVETEAPVEKPLTKAQIKAAKKKADAEAKAAEEKSDQ